jgi:hypothetical protein
MELQARFHGVGVSAVEWRRGLRRCGTSATADVQTLGDGTGSVQLESRHTIAEMWMTTSTRTRWVGGGIGGHELSKPRVIVISWTAERIGPTIIAAPQRGHAHVAIVGVSVAVDGVAAVVGRAGLRSVRARATRVARQVFARNPDCRIRTKPRGRMCWTKRRRNSIADSVIVRD